MPSQIEKDDIIQELQGQLKLLDKLDANDELYTPVLSTFQYLVSLLVKFC